MPSVRHRLVILVLAPILIVIVFASDRALPPPPAPPDDKPHALVSLGDSTISGEGAGNYEPGTRGEHGDWCHRSADAEIHHTTVPGLDRRINLACSGAAAANVGFTGPAHYTETSQARRLGELARQYRIVGVVVGVGANDDPGFANVVGTCTQAWFASRGPSCTDKIAGVWPGRVDAMIGKVVRALADVRTALRDAGYPNDSYQVVVQSYAAPVGPGMVGALQNLSGCPFRTADLDWVTGTAVPELSAGLHTAALRAGARFLDLSAAGAGHGACSTSGKANNAGEWFTRLSVDWQMLQRDDEQAAHALQESFHPNAHGYTQFGRCLTAFLRGHAPSGACVADAAGNLHPVASRVVKASG